MKKFLFLIGLILLGAVAYFGVQKFAPEIEADIKTRVDQALNTSLSNTNITANVNGRDVVLDGNVDDDQFRTQAAQLTRNVAGVRTVDNNIQVAGDEMAAVDDMSFDATEATPNVEIPAQMNNDVAEIETPQPAIMMVEPQVDDIEPALPANLNVQATLEPPPPSEMPETSQAASIVEATNNQIGAVVVEAPVTVDVPPEPVVQEPAPQPAQELVVADTVEVTDACQEKLMSLLRVEKINFASGSATINSSSYPLLNKVVTEAKKCSDATIQVHGYTDASGNKAQNRLLSHARAKSVGKYLLRKGVAREIRIFGHGAGTPIASNDTPEGRAQNRRIEFKIVKK